MIINDKIICETYIKDLLAYMKDDRNEKLTIRQIMFVLYYLVDKMDELEDQVEQHEH